MTANPPPPAPKVSALTGRNTRAALPWGLIVLLVFMMILSFFDRGNMSVAAPVLAPELKLSPWAMGLLFSAFFWTYAPGQIGAGLLVDRFAVRWVIAGGFVLWAFATLSTAVASSFSGLLCLRMLLGLGESVAYPACSRIVAAVFPEDRRGLVNSLIDLGARLGPALGILCGALLVAKLGWRGLFLATGCAVALWLVLWMALAPRSLVPQAAARANGPGWLSLMRRRAVWGTFGGLFGANYCWGFLSTWLPSYLANERNFSLKSIAIVGAVPYLLMAVASVSCGTLADRLIMRGGAPVRVRKGFMVGGLLLTAALMPMVLLPRLEWAIGALMLTCFAFGIYASNLWSLTQTLAGAEAAGRWTGLQNAVGNLGSLLAPALTGCIVGYTGHYALGFFFASAACLGGASSFWFLVRDSDRGGWKPPTT